MPEPKLGVTLTRHIFESQREHPQATGELSGILNQIALAAKVIAREVNKAGLAEILGLTGEENVQGEEVKKLDEFANGVCISAFDHSGHFCIMASEEMEGTIPIPPEFPAGRYAIAFDPLDGSSNIDVNVSIGTIVTVHRKISHGPRGSDEDLLQPGRRLVAAAYVVYGSSTMLVMSTGNGVHGFTLDPSVGEFLLSHPDIRIPRRGRIYSVNEGNYPYWSEGVQRYVNHIKERDASTGRPYSSRYIGSMVADMHRTLLYGGIFMYPEDRKDPRKPEGKLRLLYECAPLAFLAEQAGGAASTGREPILDVRPSALHQRIPFFAGSLENVREVEAFIRKHNPTPAPAV